MERKTYQYDAHGKILGRLATEIAGVLSGKRKVDYTPHIDGGDRVVVINAEKISVTGNKMNDKVYYGYTGYPGGLTEITLKEMLKKKPEDVIRKAVYGMLPKNKLRDPMMKRLHVLVGDKHNHKVDAEK